MVSSANHASISKLQWIKMALVPCSSVEKLTNSCDGSPLYPVSIAIIILNTVRAIVTVKCCVMFTAIVAKSCNSLGVPSEHLIA